MEQESTKACRKCGEEKPLSAFDKHYKQYRTLRVYLDSHCRPCKAEQLRTSRRAKGIPCKAVMRPHFNETLGCTAKRCSRCTLIKPMAEYRAAGNISKCKDCYKEVERERRAANPEPHRETVKRYCKTHKEQVNERRKVWAKRNAERLRERARQSYRKHAEKRKQAVRRYKQNCSPEQRAKLRQSASECEIRRRAQKFATEVAPVKRADILKRDGAICYFCHEALDLSKKGSVTLEHLTPLSRGGTHTPDNLRIACRSCNSRKHNKTE